MLSAVRVNQKIVKLRGGRLHIAEVMTPEVYDYEPLLCHIASAEADQRLAAAQHLPCKHDSGVNLLI